MWVGVVVVAVMMILIVGDYDVAVVVAAAADGAWFGLVVMDRLTAVVGVVDAAVGHLRIAKRSLPYWSVQPLLLGTPAALLDQHAGYHYYYYYCCYCFQRL